MLTFIESYGRNAVEDPRYAPVIDPAARRRNRAARRRRVRRAQRLADLAAWPAAAAGWRTRRSVSGLKIDNQHATAASSPSDRLTLSSIVPATRAGRPPASCRAPTGRGRRARSSASTGSTTPARSATAARTSASSPMPDQYTLAEFERLEHGADGPRAADGAARADLQPRAVDAVPEARRLGRGRRRLGVRPAGGGRRAGRRGAGRTTTACARSTATPPRTRWTR